jgi:hypothetical protein
VVRVTNNLRNTSDYWIYYTSVTLALLITLKYQQYSAIVHLHQLQFTVANALGFPLFSTSRLRATAFNTTYNSFTLQLLHTLKVFYSQKHSLQFTIQFLENVTGTVTQLATPGTGLSSTVSVRELLLVKVKVKVTLRLMVGQSVSLGVEPHLGLMTRYILLFDSYGLVFVGRPL